MQTAYAYLIIYLRDMIKTFHMIDVLRMVAQGYHIRRQRLHDQALNGGGGSVSTYLHSSALPP